MRGTRRPEPKPVSDEDVRALLDRYRCPVAFHAVRTRFLGSIASPGLSVAPLETVRALWGGELPTFDSLDAVDELLNALIMNLWNRLSRHQHRSAPFRLTRVVVGATREGIELLALIRREELDGFIEGLFGTAESLELPERAHRAMGTLSQTRAFFRAMRELADDPTRPATLSEIAKAVANIRELTRISEHEIHEAVLSCARARRQILDLMSVAKPTIH